MIKTNISVLENLQQKKIVYEISFQEYTYTNIVNHYITKLRNQLRNVVSFNNYNNIIVDDRTAIEELKKICDSNDLNVCDVELDFNKKDDLLKRYIGEAISQQLRNRFEKLVITNQGKDWFKAIDFDQKEKYGLISLFKGFRFKIVSLKDTIGIIINPKSKFYTDLTLRDLQDKGVQIGERYLEKVCPLNDCKQKFNPFSTCRQGNPESFGILYKNNLFENKRPSEEGLIDFHLTEGCEKGILGDYIEDKSPIIKHYFGNYDKPYFYPLELIRISPKFEDAEGQTGALSDEVVLSPDERFTRIKDSLDYFETFKEINFPITVSDPLEIKSSHLTSEKFEKPTYLINEIEIKENPYESIKKGEVIQEKNKIKIVIILPHFVQDLYENVTHFFKDFQKYYNCTIDFEYINLKTKNIDKIKPNKKKNAIYLILKEKGNYNEEIFSFLIKNGCKFHDIHLSTIKELNLYKKENIYPGIYHKLFPPFFKLKEDDNYKTITMIKIQASGEKSLYTYLQYKTNGEFIKGYYIKDDDIRNFMKKMEIALQSLNQDENLIILNGNFPKILREYFNKKELKFIFVSENPMVRLFKFSYGKPSKSGVPTGNGAYFENNWYIITYDSHQGTQRSIKLRNNGYSFEEFKDIAELCFQATKYHPGYSDTSMRLPYPIHFAKKTLKKLKKLNFDELEINYPIYL